MIENDLRVRLWSNRFLLFLSPDMIVIFTFIFHYKPREILLRLNGIALLSIKKNPIHINETIWNFKARILLSTITWSEKGQSTVQIKRLF